MNEQKAQPPEEQQQTSSTPAPERERREEADGDAKRATLPVGTATPTRPEYADSNISAVREGIRSYGQPFLAYLILDGVEQRAPDIVEQFKASFYDYHPNRDAFIRSELEHLGWQQQLLKLSEDNGLAPEALRWDFDALWEHLNRLYRTTERLGGVYVFTR